MAAGVTLVHVATEGRGAAGGEVTQDLLLGRRRATSGPTIVVPVGAYHVGDLEPRSHSDRRLRGLAEHAAVGSAKQVERTPDLLGMLDANVHVGFGRAKRAVPQQRLHHGHVGAGLHEVRGEAVS